MTTTPMKRLLPYLALAAAVFCFFLQADRARAYPKPSINRIAWELDFQHGAPTRIVVKSAGQDGPKAYWYMPFTVTNLTQDEQRKITRVLDHVPRGASVLALASGHCDEAWEAPRHWHLGALVISRRYGFSNDQWQLPGAQLLSVKHAAAVPFHDSRSVMIFSDECAASLRQRGFDGVRTTQQSLEEFPRTGFGYVWLIKPPSSPFVLPEDLTMVWSSDKGFLYRVGDRAR